MDYMTPGEQYLARRQLERIAEYQAEDAAIEARNGELPTLTQDRINAIKSQIEAARVERQTAKDSLAAARAAAIVVRDQLAADLLAATTAPQRQAIRVQIDANKVVLDKAVADLDFANGTLASLIEQKNEALFQERLAKQALTADDLPRVARDKEQQQRDREDKRTWLARMGR
jgi:hypothetical protein